MNWISPIGILLIGTACLAGEFVTDESGRVIGRVDADGEIVIDESLMQFVEEQGIPNESQTSAVPSSSYSESRPRGGGLLSNLPSWRGPVRWSGAGRPASRRATGLVDRLRGLMGRRPVEEVVYFEQSSDDVAIEAEIVESTAEPCVHCGQVVRPMPAQLNVAPTGVVGANQKVPARVMLGNLRSEHDSSVEQPAESSPEPLPTPTLEGLPGMPADHWPTPEVSEPAIKTIGAWMPESSSVHAADFSWIEGTVQQLHTRGGAWVLRYLPYDQNDQFGGQVELNLRQPTDDIRNGDLVRVTGELVPGRRSALYRVKTIKVISGPALASP